MEAKGLLAAYGIAVVPTEVARTPEKAGVLAAPTSGFIFFMNPLWDRLPIAVGIAGIAVLALHLVNVTHRGKQAG